MAGPSSVTLQQNTNLANPAGWTPATGLSITTANGTGNVTITQAQGGSWRLGKEDGSRGLGEPRVRAEEGLWSRS